MDMVIYQKLSALSNVAIHESRRMRRNGHELEGLAWGRMSYLIASCISLVNDTQRVDGVKPSVYAVWKMQELQSNTPRYENFGEYIDISIDMFKQIGGEE